MAYWLFKSEPECFSINDLACAPDQTTSWDGVRNYQARNFMRSMKIGDEALFYHSGKEPEVCGIMTVVKEAHPDHTAFDPTSDHYDAQSTPEQSRWDMVDLRLTRRFARCVPRALLRDEPELAGMELMKKGSRLSVQPVEPAAFARIVRLADDLAREPQTQESSR